MALEYAGFLIIVFLAYILGSIPTGYILTRLIKGVDIRTVGSGNIGATNAVRAGGKRMGLAVLFLDTLKGFAAVLVLPILYTYITPWQVQEGAVPDKIYMTRLLTAFFVIIGHNYTCFLHFKGGKGIATSAGVLIALVPKLFLIGFLCWTVLFLLTKYVSVASLAVSVIIPALACFFGYETRLTILLVTLGILSFWKHKDNIKRLASGSENRASISK